MSIFPYNMLVADQDEITLEHLTSCMGVNDGTWKDPHASWLASFANYGFITTGRRLHGDNQPRGWVGTLTKQGTDPEDEATYNESLTNYWNHINCWANIIQEASNTCTNAYTAIYDTQLYVLLASTNKWTRVDNRNGRAPFPLAWYPTNSFTSPVDGVTYYDDYGNQGWTNLYLGTEKMLHNALMPMHTVDASDVIGCMATCKARLFNPTGAAYDATPKIMVEIGIDNKYNTDTIGSGVLAGTTYLPGLGGSASKLLPEDGTPIRVTFTTLATTGTVTGNAFNSVWTDTLTNIPYLTEAEMSANLPVLTLSTPTRLIITIEEAVTLGPLPWVPTPLASATMFASPTGNDANPGTFASPKTFQGAITAATPGSVVFLRGGTYPVADAAHIQAWAEGTAGAPIIFESYPDELAIIDGSGMTPWVGNKRINVSGQYQKFRGLRITGFPENGFLVGTGSHHTTIDGCEIDNCHLSGIMNFNSSDNRYINCYVHDCSDVGGAANGGNADGISVASGSRNYVGNCLVENCSDDGIDAWQSQDTVFEFNIVRGCGLGDGNGNGFKCGGADIGANAMVNNNLAYNNRALGFDVNTGINVTFKNNTSYNNDAQGYGLESDTIAINNVSSGDGSIKYGTGIPTNNSWNIGGTLTFISTVEGDANFLKVTQGGAFDGIGWEYI